MNDVYLYKSTSPNLAPGRFVSEEDLNDFLASFTTPSDLFEDLRSKNPEDRFSFLVEDYVELEKLFSGVSKTNGMDFRLARLPNGEIIGFVRYVLPETEAFRKGIKRGDVFTEVNGTTLNENSDFNAIFGADSYSITLATVDETGTISETGEEIVLTQIEMTENPILISKVIDFNGSKIGYIKYNSFVADFDQQLNDAFGALQNEGIEDLVLDLRYNGGGSVRSAIDLSTMITGQFTGEIFLREIWNDRYQEVFESDNPEFLLRRFSDTITNGMRINTLQLDRVAILTTSGSASASELVINSLEPYIDVIHIGEVTTGKFQASATLYDAENYRRENANPNHTYAIQPLIFKSANRDGKTDFVNGLAPDFLVDERISTMGTLGDPEEPFLKIALDYLANGTFPAIKKDNSTITLENIGESKMFSPTYQKMYINNNKLPVLGR